MLKSVSDRFRSSLFGVPAIWIGGAVVASQAATAIDRRTDRSDLPALFDTTVDSARSILAAISSGTITAASVVFSLTLVSIQMSTSVYSSRVLRSFLRDRFQQHMIGVLMSTFLYSLLVLRTVRGPLEEGGTPYVPRLSVFIAVVLALASVLALLGSISHTAQSLRVSAVTRDLLDEVLGVIEDRFPERHDEQGAVEPDDTPASIDTQTPGVSPARVVAAPSPPPDTPGAVLTARMSGWLQQISVQAIRDAVPDGTVVRLDVVIGSYVMRGSPLLTTWPAPHGDEVDRLRDELTGAFGIGTQRTLHQDVAFGLMLLEDVAVKALSPGVNDPNTAKVVIVQSGEAVLSILERRLAPTELRLDRCVVYRLDEPCYRDYVFAAFNQIRHYAVGQPSVQLVLVRTIGTIWSELERRRTSTPEARSALAAFLQVIRADIDDESPDPDVAMMIGVIDALDLAPPIGM